MTGTYSYARDNLAQLWDEVEDSREEVIFTRRGHEDLALLPARELRSLQETAHLLRSPQNATRLLRALAREPRRRSPHSSPPRRSPKLWMWGSSAWRAAAMHRTYHPHATGGA
jgi:antitoxin YefM